jgi:hypothetical protein
LVDLRQQFDLQVILHHLLGCETYTNCMEQGCTKLEHIQGYMHYTLPKDHTIRTNKGSWKISNLEKYGEISTHCHEDL